MLFPCILQGIFGEERRKPHTFTEMKKERADLAVKEKKAAEIIPCSSATSISVALDEIDQNYLLPAMSKLRQMFDVTAGNSFTKPHGWSFPLCKESKKAPAAVVSKKSEDANHANHAKQDAAEEVSSNDREEDARGRCANSEQRNLPGLSLQTDIDVISLCIEGTVRAQVIAIEDK